MSLSRQVASPGGAEASAHPADRSDGTTGPPAAAETGAAPPLRSVHTTNFPALLDQLGISLLVTTYQAGKLVVLRPDEDHVNTHFRNFSKPMGLAVAGDRLAIGTLLEIWEFHNVPAVIRQAGADRQARRLLSAALEPCHRRRPDPRDGLGR